jgi:hypothetical protein
VRFQREKEEKKLMRKMGVRLGSILSALLAGVRAEAVAWCGFNCYGMESDAQSIFFSQRNMFPSNLQLTSQGIWHTLE